MKARIEFLEGLTENSIPSITLTRSKDGSTATAIFKFHDIVLFNKDLFLKHQINHLTLLDENIKLKTNILRVIFANGKPQYISALFIFKTKLSWIQFIQFMKTYSSQKGLVFKSYKN